MKKARILVVDDDTDMRELLDSVFSLNGYDVDVACNGREAVAKCRSAEYDAITMDVDMPVMNGSDAISTIRRDGIETPIVLITGRTVGGDDALRESVSRVLTKPFGLVDLRRVVRAAIDGRADGVERMSTAVA